MWKCIEFYLFLPFKKISPVVLGRNGPHLEAHLDMRATVPFCKHGRVESWALPPHTHSFNFWDLNPTQGASGRGLDRAVPRYTGVMTAAGCYVPAFRSRRQLISSRSARWGGTRASKLLRIRIPEQTSTVPHFARAEPVSLPEKSRHSAGEHTGTYRGDLTRLEL